MARNKVQFQKGLSEAACAGSPASAITRFRFLPNVASIHSARSLATPGLLGGTVAKAGCTHQVVKTGSAAAAARTPGFKWVNTALGNIKAAIVRTYRAIDQKPALPRRVSNTASTGDTILARASDRNGVMS